jgi:hypothetical protein
MRLRGAIPGHMLMSSIQYHTVRSSILAGGGYTYISNSLGHGGERGGPLHVAGAEIFRSAYCSHGSFPPDAALRVSLELRFLLTLMSEVREPLVVS